LLLELLILILFPLALFDNDDWRIDAVGEARGGVLREGDLCEGDLCEGDLCEGDLCEGDLCEGDLCEGDLCEGDICEGDLSGFFKVCNILGCFFSIFFKYVLFTYLSVIGLITWFNGFLIHLKVLRSLILLLLHFLTHLPVFGFISLSSGQIFGGISSI
jgi:hypothetical protein